MAKKFKHGENVYVVYLNAGKQVVIPGIIYINDQHNVIFHKKFAQYYVVFDSLNMLMGHKYDSYQSTYNLFPSTDQGKADACRRLADIVSRNRTDVRKRLRKMDENIEYLRQHARILER